MFVLLFLCLLDFTSSSPLFVVISPIKTEYKLPSKDFLHTPCRVDNVTGVCLYLTECPYAFKLVTEDEKKAPLCGHDGKKIIACCPTKNILHRTGMLQRYFSASADGVIRSKDMSCRYDGTEPFLCCQNPPDPIEAPEPKQCPELPRPGLKTDLTIDNSIHHFLWNKCLNYQRYFNKCVEKDDYRHRFTRVNKCPPTDRFRISGGIPAESGEFPHMAVIGCHNAESSESADIIWIGGGSLLSDKYILTAAHVLVENKHGRVRYALLGALNKKNIKEGLLVNIVRTEPHKEYTSDEKQHDIALLELHERVKFNEFIRPACLPVQGREIEPHRIIAGWGEVSDKGKTSEVLLTATVREAPTLCQKKFDGRDFVPEMMICATGNVGSGVNQDACRGDSGGPLMAVFKNINCSYSIEGVVSFGPRCGEDAGVYTKVSNYLDWIVFNVWGKEYLQYKQKLHKASTNSFEDF